jgi:hypothetical protein
VPLTLESGGNKEQAVISFITMQLQLSSIFNMFAVGTRAHAFSRTILHGGAKVPKKSNFHLLFSSSSYMKNSFSLSASIYLPFLSFSMNQRI